jgi:hypothetical protein
MFTFQMPKILWLGGTGWNRRKDALGGGVGHHPGFRSVARAINTRTSTPRSESEMRIHEPAASLLQ